MSRSTRTLTFPPLSDETAAQVADATAAAHAAHEADRLARLAQVYAEGEVDEALDALAQALAEKPGRPVVEVQRMHLLTTVAAASNAVDAAAITAREFARAERRRLLALAAAHVTA